MFKINQVLKLDKQQSWSEVSKRKTEDDDREERERDGGKTETLSEDFDFYPRRRRILCRETR